MKRFFLVLLVPVILATGCSSVTPGPGEEAVVVRYPTILKPFYNGGVDSEPVTNGRRFIAFTSEGLIVDKKPVQYTMAIDDMFSVDNVPLDFTAVIRLRVLDSVKLATDFGVHNIEWGDGSRYPVWYSNNVFRPWERAVRRAVNKRGMSEMVSDKQDDNDQSTIEAIDAEVETELRAEFKRIGLPVELIDLTIGRANPPDEIKHQRVETARQEQLQLTEIQRLAAEEKREAAERQRAVSDNAYRQQMGLNTEQFVALEAIKMQREACLKQGCTFVTSGVGATPVINVR